jgi:hypothetical protein
MTLIPSAIFPDRLPADLMDDSLESRDDESLLLSRRSSNSDR